MKRAKYYQPKPAKLKRTKGKGQVFLKWYQFDWNILFYSILFYSILFYSILFYSILFYSILFYSASVASSSSRRLPIMDLHFSLHCGFLFNIPYSLMLVHSLMSSIHILQGLPSDFFPPINPSMMLTNKFRFGLLTIWLKNDDFRLAIFFNRVGLSFTRSCTC